MKLYEDVAKEKGIATKYITGPWRVTTDSHYNIYIHNTDHLEAGYFARVNSFTPDSSIPLATAQLIAAAPDLLEACKAALEWRGLDGDGISDPTRQQLIKAIKKAEKPHAN